MLLRVILPAVMHSDLQIYDFRIVRVIRSNVRVTPFLLLLSFVAFVRLSIFLPQDRNLSYQTFR